MNSKRPLCIVLVALLITAEVCHASNGLQLPGYGDATFGMGGAGIALPQDSLAAASNPAGMAFVASRVDLSLTTIDGAVKSTFGPLVYETSPLIPIPQFGFNWDLKNRWTAGMSAFGYGLAMNYERPFPGSTTNSRADLKQIVFAPTLTYKIEPKHAIGAAPLLAVQRFKTGGLQNVGFADTKSDTSYGAGVSVGYLGEVAHGLMIGATYSSKINMGRLDRYRDLLADAGNLDVPQQAGLGLSWRATRQLTLAFDYLWINWSQTRPIGNGFPGNGQFGSEEGPGFGWNDQNVLRFGIAYDVSEKWTVRVGISRANDLIPAENVALNVVAPLVPHVTGTLGTTYRIDPQQSIVLAYGRAFEKFLNGTGASTGISTGGSLTYFVVGYGYKF